MLKSGRKVQAKIYNRMRSKSSLYSRYFTYIKPVMGIPVIRNYAPAVFALLTMSILTFFAIKPTAETILILQKQLTEQEQILDKITEKSGSLSLGKKNYDNLDADVKLKISSYIPDSVNLGTIIRSLEDTAKIYDASISALQFQPLTIPAKEADHIGTISEMLFIFNAQGNYPKLISLLQKLMTSSRLISIDSVSISKTSEGDSLLMSLSGKAFYLK